MAKSRPFEEQRDRALAKDRIVVGEDEGARDKTEKGSIVN
jgi:hypothetical protein